MSKLGRTRQAFALGFLRVSLYALESMVFLFGKKPTSFAVRIDRSGWATTTWLIGYADFVHLFMVFSTFFKLLYPSFYITIVYGIILVDIFQPVMNPQWGFSHRNKEFDYSSLLLTSFKRGSHLKN